MCVKVQRPRFVDVKLLKDGSSIDNATIKCIAFLYVTDPVVRNPKRAVTIYLRDEGKGNVTHMITPEETSNVLVTTAIATGTKEARTTGVQVEGFSLRPREFSMEIFQKLFGVLGLLSEVKIRDTGMREKDSLMVIEVMELAPVIQEMLIDLSVLLLSKPRAH